MHCRHRHSSTVVRRVFHLLPTGALLLSAGCAVQPVDVVATRAACGLSPTQEVLGDHLIYSLSEDCVRALTNDVGFDWAAARLEPSAMELDFFRDQPSVPQQIVGALYLLLSTPMPDIREELAMSGMPPVLLQALTEVRDTNGFSEDLPASYLYYGLVAGRTRTLTFEKNRSRTIAAEYNALVATTKVNVDLLDPSMTDWPVTLVHETIHTWNGHSWCSPTSNKSVPETPPVVDAAGSIRCDRTSDGAFGSGAWYHWRWKAAAACHGAEYDGGHCSLIASPDICYGQIVDAAGFPPCELTRVVRENTSICEDNRHLIEAWLPQDCPPYIPWVPPE